MLDLAFCSCNYTSAPCYNANVRSRSFVRLPTLPCQFNLLPRRPLLLVRSGLADVKTQAIRVQIHLVLTLLQDLSNVLRILELP
jgi:hypothetical protein